MLLKMSSNRTKQSIYKVFWTMLLLIIGATTITPFLWMLSASMKVSQDVMRLPIEWIPKYFYFDNYIAVWDFMGKAKVKYHFDVAYINSLAIAAYSLVGSVLTSSLAGYAFAKIKFRGASFIFLVYLSTMMIPSQVTLVPRFVMFKEMGMVGTHLPLILPHLITITGTFMMRQYFLQIPNELR